MRACGQKLVKFCTHTHTLTHTRGKISSSDISACTQYLHIACGIAQGFVLMAYA